MPPKVHTRVGGACADLGSAAVLVALAALLVTWLLLVVPAALRIVGR